MLKRSLASYRRFFSRIPHGKASRVSSLNKQDYPILDIDALHRSKDEILRNAANRGSMICLDNLFLLSNRRKAIITEINGMEMRRNEISKVIRNLRASSELNQALLNDMSQESKDLRLKIQTLNEENAAVQAGIQKIGQKLPNLTSPDTPIGSEDQAKILNIYGKAPEFTSFRPKSHIELSERLEWIDFDDATVTSGPRTATFVGMGAALEMALTSWAIQKLVKRGFKLHHPPDLVRNEFVRRCGFMPGGDESSTKHIYHLEDSDLCLAGTSEIPLMSMLYDTILKAEELPLRIAGVSHCFRTEVGHANTDNRGIYRLHQFTKVEMVAITLPCQSEELHKEMLEIQIELYNELGLHFRVLEMPSEELGATAYRKFDCEAWIPSQSNFGEVGFFLYK